MNGIDKKQASSASHLNASSVRQNIHVKDTRRLKPLCWFLYAVSENGLHCLKFRNSFLIQHSIQLSNSRNMNSLLPAKC